jgi:hypothetical protein
MIGAAATVSGHAPGTPSSETLSRTTARKSPCGLSYFLYLGAFVGNVTATAWEPGNSEWQVKGVQGVVTQVPIGMGINFIGEFAPEITRGIKHNK